MSPCKKVPLGELSEITGFIPELWMGGLRSTALVRWRETPQVVVRILETQIFCDHIVDKLWDSWAR